MSGMEKDTSTTDKKDAGIGYSCFIKKRARYEVIANAVLTMLHQFDLSVSEAHEVLRQADKDIGRIPFTWTSETTASNADRKVRQWN